MTQFKSSFVVGLPLSGLALLVSAAISLQAEDIIVTSYIGDNLTSVEQSSPYGFDSFGHYGVVSAAVPAGAGRSYTAFGVGTNGAWALTPKLGTGAGVYRVYVSQGATYNCSPDLHVKLVATSGCTLADTNYVGRTQIDVTAFQAGASLNVWTPIAVISNSSTTPRVTFSYASGASNRWYMDEVRFENIASSTLGPARITAVSNGNPFTIRGTGPVSRPFALVSSTDARKPLSQWTPEQTNTAGSGSFTFPVTLGAAKAKFFRVVTQ